MQLAMVNDHIVPLNELDPVYLDRGTYFGDGVYEVIRSYDGRIFALTEHMERFEKSLSAIEITGIDIDDIRMRVEKAYETANIANARIYFHITRGSEHRNHLPGPGLRPNFLLIITQLHDSSSGKLKGIKVSTYPDLRWKRCDIKSLNLLPNVLARIDAEKKGCSEAILVNDAGQITEGAGSAFFAVDASRKEIITRFLGPEILASITRQHVIQIAPGASLAVAEKTLTPAHATAADELFLAVTTKDIVPIAEFDGVKIGNGRPGKYTKKLAEEFQKLVRR